MNKRIYLDYNATTPIGNEVLKTMFENKDCFANPASAHFDGQNALNLLEKSREIIADFLCVKPHEIIFTSGGTESNNTVLRQTLDNKNLKKLIISSIEHSSISEYAEFLKQNGVEVIKIPVDCLGFIDIEKLEEICDENSLVSVIWANNEIGTIQDVEKIAQIVKKNGGLLHFDAVQAFGKVNISLEKINADFLTFSSHKIYGPRGIGALFVRENTPFLPFIIGGGQENEFRSGTANQWLASGFAKAVELRKSVIETEQTYLWNLRKGLIESLENKIEGVSFNSPQEFGKTLCGTLSVTINDIENEIITLQLDNAGISISKGSACSSKKIRTSGVLSAVGLSQSAAARTIRVSFGKFTTKEEIEYFCEKLSEIVKNVREKRKGGHNSDEQQNLHGTECQKNCPNCKKYSKK
ncbi:MAG: cysteine desulfurase [Chitinispirillales bacterium]|jgi:cysteine desulfurase|nr:cysteine desulfurase [Chitinispirillales bacterium]